MIVFFYEKVRLKRGAWQTVSIVLLIAFLCAFLLSLMLHLPERTGYGERLRSDSRNCRRIQSYRHENR